MAVNLKDVISSLKPFAGKRMGLDFGRRALADLSDGFYEIDGIGVLTQIYHKRGYTYHYIEIEKIEADDDFGFQFYDTECVVGYSLHKEGNVFHAGTFDDWQSALRKSIDAEVEEKRLRAIERKSKDDGVSSLNAVIQSLQEIGSRGWKVDESTTFGELGLDGMDAIEFAAAFEQTWSDASFRACSFSTKACGQLYDMFDYDKTTVGQLDSFIKSLFVDDNSLKKKMMFCDSGDDCPHFDIADSARNDSDIEVFRRTSQQCYFCKHRNDGRNGEPCDSSIGECTYEWKDPNGDKQQTFWEEK